MTSDVNKPLCYCGKNEFDELTPSLFCTKCKGQFHADCLKDGKPSPLVGDVFFDFTCSKCGDGGEENLSRIRMQWTQVVHLALYNLQLVGRVGKCGYFRWKEHVCAFIDKHWISLFGTHRKKTNLWHGTVAGILSSGCPHNFVSGVRELGEAGWWRLAEMKPPQLKQGPGTGGKSGRRRLTQSPSVAEVQPSFKTDGLRSRRGKTSIEAAMELKAKRETIMEAKDIRKYRCSPSPAIEIKQEPVDFSGKIFTPGTMSPLHPVASPAVIQQNVQSPASQGSSFHSTLRNIKQEPADSGVPSAFTACLSSSGSTSGDIDEDSQFSHGSSSRTDVWLTEQDLKTDGSLPPLFMTDDLDKVQSDSDLEIDPGTITPPSESPSYCMESPTIQEMLSTLDNSNAIQYTPNLNVSPVPGTPSVVDSESERDSDSSSSSDTSHHSKAKKKKKSKPAQDERKEEDTTHKIIPISLYEEHQLLRKLNNAANVSQLTPEFNRLRRKLIVRQLKRERGLPIFDVDVEMNKLARKCWGDEWESEDTSQMIQHGLPRSRVLPGDVRVLDRFQTTAHSSQVVYQQMPSFLNRLVGIEDDQLQSIRSPYTARVLKPFIRRDYETRPLKMQLLQEIISYPHRNDPAWQEDAPPSIDYCYVRPQHIPSVNSLCREFFWPGIDLSECLQYPDFSCVVLYRRFVIGFAFLVPDVSHNEAYISFLLTHPEWRRAGIAKFMLYHLVQTCMGKDIKLHVSATNPAMLLYQQFGFKPEEYIIDFYDKYYPADSRECKHAFCLRLRK